MNWTRLITAIARGAAAGRSRRGYRRTRRPVGRRLPTGATLIFVLIAAWLSYSQLSRNERAADPSARRPPAQDAPTRSTDVPIETPAASFPGDGGIGQLFADRRSNVIVHASGTVERILPDDDHTADGSSRHQRFIVRLPGGLKVLVAHNIDLAQRAPVSVGQVIAFKGEYEWSEEGGVVHWTHRDPKRRRPDGWIEVGGIRYR